MSKRKASLGFIFVTVLVEMIGAGIIVPILPDLLKEMTGENLSTAAAWGGILMVMFTGTQALFSPLMGILSDKYGRRPILFLSLFGLGLDYVAHGLAPTVFWLIVTRIIAGIFGASFTVAMSYVADISEPKKKAQNFGIVAAAFGLGFIIGPVVGGLFADWYGIRAPFFFAAALSFLNLLYGFLILPESLPKEKRREVVWKRARPFAALLHLRKHGSFLGLIIAFFLAYWASQALQTTWSYYTIERFDWDAKMIGYSLAFVGILVAIVQGGLIKHVLRILGHKKTVIVGFSLWTFGMFLFGIVPTEVLLFITCIPYCLGGVAGPTVRGIVSNQVPDTEQGELQGAMTSVQSLAFIIGPITMASIFAFFTRENAEFYLPGAPFFLGGILFILAFIFAVNTLRKMPDVD